MTDPERDALLADYDAVVCDLDGVVYRGDEAIEGAVESLRAVRAGGQRVAYGTNNASRPPAEVAEQLRGLGLELDERDVVTSAQAGARAMVRRVGRGALVLAVGGPGVTTALEEVGLVAVTGHESVGHESVGRESPVTDGPGGGQVAGVLQGFGRQVGWSDLAEAAYAIQGGALWIATNTDATLPTQRGRAPGNGTLVAAVGRAVGADPVVVGKPHAPIYELAAAVLQSRAEHTLAVGDRIDTDIAGAHAAGMHALLVLTGVDGPDDLAVLDPKDRPRYVAQDLGALHLPYREPTEGDEHTWACGQALVRWRPAAGESCEVRRELEGLRDGDPGELVRAALAAVWQALDAGRIDPDRARRVLAGLDAPTVSAQH